jgi:organic radical activating enzyme
MKDRRDFNCKCGYAFKQGDNGKCKRCNNIARVIITEECERNCSYCCNKYESILKDAIRADSLEEIINKHDVICLTGGEPMLDIDRTLDIIKHIKEKAPEKTLYLYTAKYDYRIEDIIPLVDGIHYTMHENSTMKDIDDLACIQVTFHGHHEEKSFRLFLHSGIERMIAVAPSVWSRIESKPWIDEKELRPAKRRNALYIERQNR